MSLYIDERGIFRPWNPTVPIKGIRYQPNIGDLWPADELAALGLYEPVRPPVSRGKVVASERVARVDGFVTFVYTFVGGQASPPDPLQTRLAAIEEKLARGEMLEAALVRKAVLSSDDILKAR